MEHKLRVIEPEALMEQLPQMLEETASVPLVISGNSMSPFLLHGRDTVYLSKVTRPLKRGDMVLYQRVGGAYILHRIYKEEKGAFTLIGDGQLGLEPGIRREQILALVTAVRRKGKLLRSGNLMWEFFAHVWLALVPARPVILRLHSRLKAWRK